MRRNYSVLQDSQQIKQFDSQNNEDIDLTEEVELQLLNPRNRKGKQPINSEKTQQKLTEMKSIYLENKAQMPTVARHAKKKDSVEEKIKADELIKVLQNGRERKNQRKQKKGEDLLEQTAQFHSMKSQFRDKKSTINSQILKQEEQRSSNDRNYSIARPKNDPKPIFSQMKIIKEIREEHKKKTNNVEDWKEIQNLLSSTRGEDPEEEYRKLQRRQQLDAAKELLSGKVSIIWIFVIKEEISEVDKTRILEMYSGLSDSKYIAPIVKNASEVKSFLEVPNSLFKIVSDLSNARDILRFKINKNVIEFFILNNEGERGIVKALTLKTESRKIKGIFNVLQKIVDRAEEQIENQIQIYQTNKGFVKRKHAKKFPSFLKLSGEDKTNATLYRANLYGAKNLLKSQLMQRYLDFIDFAKQKYEGVERQMSNITLYEKLNHFGSKIEEKQAKSIINFYVKESFYYQILNSMLRTMKTTQEFKPCIFPFYQNYQAIKFYYKRELEANSRKIDPITLYRGAKLRPRDFNVLKAGAFIEMFGFMSTSKSLSRARQFTDRDGYIMVIHVPELTIPKNYDKYDHGFVDINKYDLAEESFKIEEEVLFNSLNVYKVINIENDGEYNYIHLQYGPIFQLLAKDKKNLTNDEKDVLLNYQHCAHLLDDIEDQGDVFLLANQFAQSKEYYNEKLKDGTNDKGKYLYKLANVQQQCGQLDEADKNVKASLELQVKDINVKDRQNCLKVFSIHSKNAQISIDKEDYLTADTALTQAIQFLSDDDDFEKAKKIRELGEIKFKKGEIIEAEQNFYHSENILKNLSQNVDERKKAINKTNFLFFFALLCSSTTQEEMEQDKKEKMKQIEELERKIADMKEQIDQELIKVNNSMKEAAIYAEDKEKYENYVKKSRAYLLQIQSRESKDPREKARLKALEATIRDYQQLVQTEKLLQDAISLVESSDPFDPEVGKYSEVLASFQKKQLQKFTNPKAIATITLDPSQKLKYNESEHKQVYKKAKNNYERALNVLLYHSKTKSSPQVLAIKNQIGELQFNECNFQECEKIIKEVKNEMKNTDHSEISRSCLILSKIGYARGELKSSFENVQEALVFLRNIIVKKQDEKYEAIFQKNGITLEIKMHRAKVYLKQLQHDLCLKQIKSIRQVIYNQGEYSSSHTLLADLLELEGQNLIIRDGGGDFDHYFLDAISMRQKQFGTYNLANAVTYSNFTKNLLLAGDLEEAQKMLENALEIFGCFSDDHPLTWLVIYVNGLMKQKKNNSVQALKCLDQCLKMAKKKFDRSHITLNKIRLQYGKNLYNSSKFSQSIKTLLLLQGDLDEELRFSSMRNNTENEKDDEKISVKRYLYEILRESYRQLGKSKETGMNQSQMQMDRVALRMDDLRKTYGCSFMGFFQKNQ